MMVLLENKCSFNDRDNHMWWEHTTRTSCCSDGNFVLSISGDAKTLAQALALAAMSQSCEIFTNILEIFC